MECLQSMMIASFPGKGLYLPLAAVLFSAILCSGSPKRSVDEHKHLIVEGAASVFTDKEDLTGFEIFHQEFDKDSQKTIYTSSDNPSFKFLHAGDDITSGENVIVLDASEDNIPRKDNKIMYLVLRRRKAGPNTFTAHLVYIRNLKGETSLEWDYFLSDESKEKWSFVKAFSPAKFLHLGNDKAEGNRIAREIMAAPGLADKKPRVKSSSSEELLASKKKKKEKKKKEKEESEEEEDGPQPEIPPPECNDKKPKRRKRKTPKVVYKININHIICASGGECHPDPCLGKGKKSDKGKGRSLALSTKTGETLFVGYGTCEKIEPVPSSSVPSATLWTGQDQLISFILQTLRVQCIPEAVPEIKDVFAKKLLTSDEKFHLEINDHPLFKEKAPGMADWALISSALYFKVYANTYFEEAGKLTEDDKKALSPNDQPISSSVEILTLITQKVIRYCKKLFEPHTYKLIKTLEVILENKYEDCVQQKGTMQSKQEQTTNLNDLIQLHALYKLISLESVANILAQDLTVQTVFTDLYTKSLSDFTAAAEKVAPLQH